MAVNYSILADVELNTKDIQKKLDAVKNRTLKLKVDSDADKAAKGLKDLDESTKDVSLSFQAANEIFSRSIDVIETMVEQVYKLDSAMIEFQKVSDLSGKAFEDYINKLSVMGGEVARTGKPKRLTPIVRMVN